MRRVVGMSFNEESYSKITSDELKRHEIYTFQKFEFAGNIKLKFEFVEQNSPHIQGIAFLRSRRPKFKGTMQMDDGFLVDMKANQTPIVLWEDVDFGSFTLSLKIDEGFFGFANTSDVMVTFAKDSGIDDWKTHLSKITGKPIDQLPQGSFQSTFSNCNSYGYGYWKEHISENRYRFHCNDHEKDDDFDDLIFDVEILECDVPGFDFDLTSAR